MSESTQHTPGPWRFEESKGGAWFIYGETGDGAPIKPHVKVPKRGTRLMRANARLMALAPQMYNALQAVKPMLPEDVQLKVDLLLDRARGEK